MNNHLYKNLDVTNQKFGMLTAIKKVEGSRSQWVFRCDCGNEVTVCLGRVLNGWKKSCGCLLGKGHYKHGQRHNPIYGKYRSMLKRCHYPSDVNYPRYGGRGITVCEEWRESFENFYNWALQNGYDPNVNGVYLSLDRIDNNKGYSPDNCRWVTPKIQQNNKRSNHHCEYKGKDYTLSLFADKFNMNYAFVCRRIRQGYSTEQMIEEWNLIVNMPDYYVDYYTYASETKMSKEKVRNMLVEGELKGRKINSKWYVDTRDIT